MKRSATINQVRTRAQQVIAKRLLLTSTSRGGIDEIDPNDIIYGEYSDNYDEHGSWIDVIYLNGEALRTFSGTTHAEHPLVQELRGLLRDDKQFYIVPIREVTAGFAFKKTTITNIKVSSLIQGNSRHEPSCIWEIYFEYGDKCIVEMNYQSYFAYGNTIRPNSMTNSTILDRIFARQQ